ncbi:hypothetical protein H4R19_004489 [Coemansia spiralis]|nr:hypothetical protein H4R19_004489 [Coemansia spiralis]
MTEAGVTPGRRFHGEHQSPVPSLTTEASRASSASSSVTAMSPDSLSITTPRDLLPQFTAVNHHGQKRSSEATVEPQLERQPAKRERDEDTVADGSRTAEHGSDEHRRRRRRVAGPARRKQLTGDADFVGLLGLQPLYDAFVRPYARVGERQALPDMGTAYLRDIEGAGRQSGTLDLLELVMAPPKNELDRLELLPAATVRAAFRIGGGAAGDQGGNPAKRPRVALKMSGSESRSATPRHSGKQDGDYERRSHHQHQWPSPPKAC